ncbi:MAG: methyltransferase domain-containing protein [Xanthomonadales bacterium]|nr:methyltransferase domain-containing protein [Xanthomonadales bacterium]
MAKNDTVLDVGAGTGKLSRMLASSPLGLNIVALEPNQDMRKQGVQKTNFDQVSWCCGTAEKSGQSRESFRLVTFGSSFNVVDQKLALRETARVLKPGAWFACLWNHRDIDDELQCKIEKSISRQLPEYSYGLRREDQHSIIDSNGSFKHIQKFSSPHIATVKRAHFMQAWNSHLTLKRQAGAKFESIIKAIDCLAPASNTLQIPYTTVVWMAQCQK